MSYPGDPAAGQQPQYPPYGDPNQGGFQSPAASPFGQPQPQSAPPAQPYSAPPAANPYAAPAAQPYSAPPGYGPDPAASAPYSAPPGGGYGYDPNAGLPPTSGAYGPGMMPPTSGPVGALGGPAPSGQPRNKMVPILAGLMVLFLLATAVMSVLFITKSGDYNDHKKASQQKEAQLAGDLKKSQDDLKKAQEDLASKDRDLTGSQAQADELKRQKSVISQCIRLLGEAGDASRAGNAALAAQKEAEAEPICNEAGKYLD
jgi:hypothetical protein